MVVGVILAGGKGTRMASELPKVLHRISGKTLLGWVLEASGPVVDKNIVVVGYKSDMVSAEVARVDEKAVSVLQEPQNGTGHAVQCAMPAIPENASTVIVLCGDVPLVRSATIKKLLLSHLENKNDITVVGIEKNNPDGYGRLEIKQNGDLTGIVEETDASEDQKKITLVNAGIYCFDHRFLKSSIGELSPKNAQNEYYLTDLIGLSVIKNKKAGVFLCSNPEEVLGVNTPDQLSSAAETLVSLNR